VQSGVNAASAPVTLSQIRNCRTPPGSKELHRTPFDTTSSFFIVSAGWNERKSLQSTYEDCFKKFLLAWAAGGVALR